MPRHRKVAFSNKQKKEQLKAKRERKHSAQREDGNLWISYSVESATQLNSTQLNMPRDLDGKTWPKKGKKATAYQYPLSLI